MAVIQRESIGNLNGSAMELNDSKNRKSYTLDFKRQVINFYHAHAGNITLSAKMFGVDRKMVRSWVEQQDFFSRQVDAETDQGPSTPVIAANPLVLRPQPLTKVQSAMTPAGQRKRLERTFSSGSSARYPELEKSLSDWWFSQTSRGVDIKAKDLKEQALRLFQELYPYSSDQEFKASTGWLQRFVTRMENGGIADPPQKMNTSAGNGKALQKSTHFMNIAPKPSKPMPEFRLPEPQVTLPMKRGTTENCLTAPKRSKMNAPELIKSSQTERSEQTEVMYSSMSDSERNAMDRQNQDTDKFFQDCSDFLIYLDKVSRELSKFSED